MVSVCVCVCVCVHVRVRKKTFYVCVFQNKTWNTEHQNESQKTRRSVCISYEQKLWAQTTTNTGADPSNPAP